MNIDNNQKLINYYTENDNVELSRRLNAYMIFKKN